VSESSTPFERYRWDKIEAPSHSDNEEESPSLLGTFMDIQSALRWPPPPIFCSQINHLPLAPEVSRHFEENMTMKELPALPAEAPATGAHMVSTYSINIDQRCNSAELALPTQTAKDLDHNYSSLIRLMPIKLPGVVILMVH